jgi:AraC family transcriptional regulator
MREYLLDCIDGEISLEELSRAAGYSLRHSLRIFKEMTGRTPFGFVRAVRLTEAAMALRDTDEKVLNVALNSGFDSHDGFTRAFYRQFEISPREYRAKTPPVSYFTSYPLRDYYLFISRKEEDEMEKNKVSPVVTVTAVERPARKMIILRSAGASDYFSFCGEMGCDWEGILNSAPERYENAALITLPKGLVREGTSATAAGIEVLQCYDKKLPKGYELIDLPACTMLFFQGMPFEDEGRFCEAIDIVMEAVAAYGPEDYGYSFADDIAPRFNFGASAKTGARIAVPARRL